MSSGGGGGSRSESSTTTNVPWGPSQQYLLESMGGARDLYRFGNLAPVVGESPWSVQAREMGAQTAQGGGFGATTGALDLANQTLGGEFIDPSQNPYFQDAISYAQQPVIDAWNQQIRPGIDASFGSSAGGIGSGAYAAALNRGQDVLARNLAGAATEAGAEMYDTERGRQQQAMAFAPGLEQAGYGSLDRLAGYGAQEEGREQFEAEAPLRNIQQYTGLLQGNPAFGFGTSTATGGGSTYSPGVLDYASTAGGLGLLGWSLFCDERVKQDVEYLATTEDGVKLYRFRYRFDVEELGDRAPYHIGPMAQELEKIKPEAVMTDDEGWKYVRVEAI